MLKEVKKKAHKKCHQNYEMRNLLVNFQKYLTNTLVKLLADLIITKTYLYNFDPLNPHFYIVKLGFTGVYIIFLISAQNIDCGLYKLRCHAHF